LDKNDTFVKNFSFSNTFFSKKKSSSSFLETNEPRDLNVYFAQLFERLLGEDKLLKLKLLDVSLL
jgi:hypothetical protein